MSQIYFKLTSLIISCNSRKIVLEIVLVFNFSVLIEARRVSVMYYVENVQWEYYIFSLLDGATEEQMQDFLEEIQLMKQIGYHRNILNLLACCTLTNPRFLVVEFAKNGDLLNYLRKRREQVKLNN